MPVFVPSQVVEYIEARVEAARKQCDSDGSATFYLTIAQGPTIACILSMIDDIPTRLMTLRDQPLTEFIEATEAMRMAVSAWKAGEKNYNLDKLASYSKWNPVSLVLRALSSLSDQAADAQAPGLGFVSDAALRTSLQIDVSSVNSALANAEWKAATVLAGSVVEALLLDALKSREAAKPGGSGIAAASLVQQSVLTKHPPADLEQWELHALTEVAFSLNVVAGKTASQCRLCRQFRNLVHPGRSIRLAESCNRGTSLAAAAAMELVIHDLS